jgi:ribosomal protein S18 acetylase RimI-like enzyme
MIDTKLVRGRADLEQVLALQRENLRDRVSTEAARRDGFVTVAHSLESLEAMHALAPSVIARQGEEFAGYALVMPVEARPLVPILEPLFAMLDTLLWRGQPVAALPFYVMGQICVARDHRGKGVVDALYAAHRTHYAERYSLCVTEIATRNTRSMRAHERVGFEVVATYRDVQDEWAVVAWDWSAR